MSSDRGMDASATGLPSLVSRAVPDSTIADVRTLDDGVSSVHAVDLDDGRQLAVKQSTHQPDTDVAQTETWLTRYLDT